MMRNPNFYVHGVKISNSYKLKENDELECPSSISFDPVTPAPTGHLPLFTSNIVFEDSDIIAFNKPVGLASQGGINIRLSADQLASEYAGGKLMHRLDKDVSGLLLFGKSKEACSLPFHNKTYFAILQGKIPKQGEMTDSISSIGKVQGLSDSGKPALTTFETLSSSDLGPGQMNLVKLQLLTGRKHQIRVHCSKSLNCPILGDTKYGGLESTRIFLHSYSCLIKGIELKAEIPEDFQSKLQELGLNFP